MPHTLPSAFINSVKDAPGFSEEAFVDAHSQPEQVTSIRFNPLKINGAIIDGHPFGPIKTVNANSSDAVPVIVESEVPWCATGRYLSGRPSFTHDPFLHAGAYYVQEASSMFLHHVLESLFAAGETPKQVLDLCAAPGGKSTLLAAALPDSFIVSNEVIKNRVTILAENISKWGSSNVAVTHNDAADFQQLPGFFDLIVVDAPCSGSGLFRKDARAIDEWSEANVFHCSLRQQRILSDVLPALASGGYLVYSTCSYSTKEDEEICDWLVSEIKLEPVNLPLPTAWNVVQSFSPVEKGPGYRFYPDKIKGEGFFIACFRKPGDAEGQYGRISLLPAVSRNERVIIDKWLQDAATLHLFKQKETIIGFPTKWLPAFSTVQNKLHVRKSGVAVGVIKGAELVPHHELALSSLCNPLVPVVEMDLEQALDYLSRKEFNPGTTLKGWALARYKGLNLGWMKLLGNRVNNYYPTEWRILKP